MTTTRKTRKKKDKLWPHKYYRGLTKKQALERKKEINKFGAMKTNDPKAYVGFKSKPRFDDFDDDDDDDLNLLKLRRELEQEDIDDDEEDM